MTNTLRHSGDRSTEDRWLVRRLRPLRERWLRRRYGRMGMPRVVNDIEMRVLPEYRWYFSPQYDAPVAAYLRSRVQAGSVCLSVGANIGMYPLQFSAWSAPTGRVYAFEPNPATADVLRRHIEINQLSRRIEVVESAVSDCIGTGEFHAAGTDGMSRLGSANPELGGTTHVLPVPVTTLDQFCADRGICPDVLMMDIEGFEIAAMTGATRIFTRDRPLVAVIELHPDGWAPAGTSREMLERLLVENRLRAVSLSGHPDALGTYGHVAIERAF